MSETTTPEATMTSTPAVLAPWAPGNRTAYNLVTDLDGIVKGFARRRSIQHFIVSPDALAAHPCSCPACGEAITDKANRGEYDPRTKTWAVMHYSCSMTSLLAEVAKIREIA